MRVFVADSTGFIGNHVVGELIDAGHMVTGLTRSAEGSPSESLGRSGS